MLTCCAQRWLRRCATFVSPRGPAFVASRYDVAEIADDTTARRFAVERDAALIARLGGHTIAEGLAGLCEQHGGPAALVAAVRRVVALANGRG